MDICLSKSSWYFYIVLQKQSKYLTYRVSWDARFLFARLYVLWYTKHGWMLMRQIFYAWSKGLPPHWIYHATGYGINSTTSVLCDSIRYACYHTYTWIGTTISPTLSHKRYYYCPSIERHYIFYKLLQHCQCNYICAGAAVWYKKCFISYVFSILFGFQWLCRLQHFIYNLE